MRIRHGLLVLVAGIGMSVPALAEGKSRYERKLHAALEHVVAAKDGPPGASALLQRGRDTWTFMRAGVGDVETGRSFGARQRMRIASVSKAFSGAVALALVDRGVLSLDDTVGARVPGMPSEWGAATLRQLLGHTSGIPDLTADPGFINALVADPRAQPTPEQLIGYMTEPALEFPPGSDYHYSNTENILVGLIAQSATGKPYEQLLDELVFTPLELERTALPRGVELPSPRIAGYDTDPLEDVTECCAAAWSWAAGGIYSTPLELTRFTSAYVGGRLFGGPAREAQFSSFRPGGASQPPGPGGMAAGLALFRYRTPCGTVFGHTGNTFGYTQFTAATRNGRRAVTVSVNAQVNFRRAESFAPLKRAYRLAACAVLERRS